MPDTLPAEHGHPDAFGALRPERDDPQPRGLHLERGRPAAGRLQTLRVREGWVADEELSDQARNNSLDNFRLAFERKFLQTIVTRVDTNDEIYKRILDDEDFQATLGEFYARKVYERLREVDGPPPRQDNQRP